MWTERFLWCNRPVFNNHCCFISFRIYFSQEAYVSGIQINGIKLNADWLDEVQNVFHLSYRILPIFEWTLINGDWIYCSGCLLRVCNINQRAGRDDIHLDLAIVETSFIRWFKKKCARYEHLFSVLGQSLRTLSYTVKMFFWSCK